MRGDSINDESKQAKAEEKQGKQRKKAIMIIIDEEDQSSIMLSMMLASMLILDSSIFFSLGFALSPLAFFFITPAHLVFRFACGCLNCSAWRVWLSR